MKNILCLIYSLICLFLASSVFAQESETEDETENPELNQTVEILTEWRPTVKKAEKKNDLPAVQKASIEKPTFNYSITSKPVKTSFSATPIKAAKMRGEALAKLYKNLITVGFGTPTTSLVNIRANSDRSSKHSYGLEANHFANAGKVKLNDSIKQPTSFSNNYLHLYGKKFNSKSMLLGGLDIDRQTYRFYGYDTERDTVLDKKSIKQRFFGAQLNAGIQNINAAEESFQYSVMLNSGLLNDISKVTEINAGLKADFSKLFGDKKVGLDLSTDYYDIVKGVDYKNGSVNFQASPWAELKSGEWVIKAGVNTYASIGDYKEFKLFPKFQIDFHLPEIKTLPYLFYKGQGNYHSYRSVAAENPFVYSGIKVAPSYEKNNVGTGLRGTLLRNIPFLIEASYKQIDSMHLYVDNYDLTDSIANKFGVVYDNASVFQIRSEIGLVKKEKFKGFLKNTFTSYTMENEERAWNIPSLESSLAFQYNMQDKIIADIELFYNSKRYAKPIDEEAEPVVLKGYFDASLNIEYRYTKLLSIFLHFNNLTNTKFTEWNYYNSYKFNTLFGVTYAL